MRAGAKYCSECLHCSSVTLSEAKLRTVKLPAQGQTARRGGAADQGHRGERLGDPGKAGLCPGSFPGLPALPVSAMPVPVTPDCPLLVAEGGRVELGSLRSPGPFCFVEFTILAQAVPGLTPEPFLPWFTEQHHTIGRTHRAVFCLLAVLLASYRVAQASLELLDNRPSSVSQSLGLQASVTLSSEGSANTLISQSLVPRLHVGGRSPSGCGLRVLSLLGCVISKNSLTSLGSAVLTRTTGFISARGGA